MKYSIHKEILNVRQFARRLLRKVKDTAKKKCQKFHKISHENWIFAKTTSNHPPHPDKNDWRETFTVNCFCNWLLKMSWLHSFRCAPLARSVSSHSHQYKISLSVICSFPFSIRPKMCAISKRVQWWMGSAAFHRVPTQNRSIHPPILTQLDHVTILTYILFTALPGPAAAAHTHTHFTYVSYWTKCNIVGIIIILMER